MPLGIPVLYDSLTSRLTSRPVEARLAWQDLLRRNG